jgi:hypothetical protein
MPLSKKSKMIYNPQTGGNQNIEETVEVAASSVSYEQGQPRKHHSFYFDSGDLTIQAS